MNNIHINLPEAELTSCNLLLATSHSSPTLFFTAAWPLASKVTSIQLIPRSSETIKVNEEYGQGSKKLHPTSHSPPSHWMVEFLPFTSFGASNPSMPNKMTKCYTAFIIKVPPRHTLNVTALTFVWWWSYSLTIRSLMDLSNGAAGTIFVMRLARTARITSPVRISSADRHSFRRH